MQMSAWGSGRPLVDKPLSTPSRHQTGARLRVFLERHDGEGRLVMAGVDSAPRRSGEGLGFWRFRRWPTGRDQLGEGAAVGGGGRIGLGERGRVST